MGALLTHILPDVIGPAMCARTISDEGIDRYLSVGLIRFSRNEGGLIGRSVRMKPTWQGAKRDQTGAEPGAVKQCSLTPQEIQLSSFASCCRDVL